MYINKLPIFCVVQSCDSLILEEKPLLSRQGGIGKCGKSNNI
jgi:hypothetical protein